MEEETNKPIVETTDETVPIKNKVVFNNFDLAVASAGLVFSIIFLVYPVIAENKRLELASVAEALRPVEVSPFSSLALEAKAAYVLDLNSGEVIFEKNSEVQLPLASLTKIMTAITALSIVPEGTVITIDKEDLELEGDSGLYADERWRLGDLLGLTLIESSNDGAYAVAASIGSVIGGVEDKNQSREAFVRSMNEKAKELGLSQTYFNNPTGLDESAGFAGAYGSARDVASLIAYGVSNYSDIFRTTRDASLKVESLNAPSHTAVNTNKDLDGIPVIIASKTGYTDLSGGNLAIIFNPGINNPIAVVVLGSTLNGRFQDVKNLAWAVIDSLVNN